MERSSTAGRDLLPALGRVCHACDSDDPILKRAFAADPRFETRPRKDHDSTLVVCRPGSTEWSESTLRSCNSHIVLLA